jgi:hypothetical protein
LHFSNLAFNFGQFYIHFVNTLRNFIAHLLLRTFYLLL